jgi:hypothetical protein
MRTVNRTILLLCLGMGISGCAHFRLNGCRRLAACGKLGAYVCDEDLICADADGRTVRSERLSSSSDPCHICPRE